MTRATVDTCISLLEAAHISLAPGLSEAELARAELHFGFRFPPDLRALLATALPVGDRFPNWRALDPDLERQTAWPVEGFLFDVERNGLWLEEWGPRPEALSESLALARARLAEAPRLIPLYSHRYLPSVPCCEGNPVLSVYQSDIIVYGADLGDYLRAEFHLGRGAPPSSPTRELPFWSAFVDG